MVKILINGYKGFIASNYFKKYKKSQKIIHYKKNINEINEFQKFIIKKKFSHFIHFAGLSRVKCISDIDQCIQTNYESIKKIIKILNTLKEKPILIFISTCHVYGNSKKKLKENSALKPKDLYGKLKLKSEQYIKKNYKNSCILRLFNVHGKNPPEGIFYTDMLNKLKNNQMIIINDSIRDFIHVNEVSKILNYIIKNNILGTLNLGSGHEYKLKNILRTIIKKYKIKNYKIKVLKKTDNIVADITKLKKIGYKFSSNEKYISF